MDAKAAQDNNEQKKQRGYKTECNFAGTDKRTAEKDEELTK